MRILSFIFAFFISYSCVSQTGGERIFNFLNITTSAKQAALGGETLTLFNDVNQPFWNPSTINQEMDDQVSLNYTDFLADVNYGSAAYAHKFTRRFGTIHAGIIYANFGNLIGADENGEETGTFKASDIALQLGYAYELPFDGISVGANVKFISSSIENYVSNGLAADFGISYSKVTNPLKLTAVIRNVGYQMTSFDQQREQLPLEVAVGGSYRLENVPLRWHITLNNLQKWKLGVPNPSDAQSTLDGQTTNKKITFLDQVIRHVAIGGEFFPEKGFNLRLGYNFRRGRELRLAERRTFAGFTAGFGLKVRRFKFNYAFSKFHPASNTNTFSLQIDLAKTGLKRY